MSFLLKNELFWLKTVKNLLFIDFAVVHPLKGKVKDVFFFLFMKIVSLNLRICLRKP